MGKEPIHIIYESREDYEKRKMNEESKSNQLRWFLYWSFKPLFDFLKFLYNQYKHHGIRKFLMWVGVVIVILIVIIVYVSNK